MADLHFAGWVRSPLGDLVILLAGDRLAEICIEPMRPDRPPTASGGEVFDDIREQLDSYFRGERQTFDLPLAPVGSAFDLRVWTAVCAIPYGQTASYSEIARRIGHPGAARAVGSANARNPLMIVTPCHRVIAADGRLSGTGVGRERRRQLLEHEGVSVRGGRVVERGRLGEA